MRNHTITSGLGGFIDAIGEARVSRALDRADRLIPKLRGEDLATRQLELGVRLWIEDYADRLREDLATEAKQGRLHARAVVFCTCDPEDPETSFERPRALVMEPSDGNIDDDFVAHVERVMRAGFALAVAYVMGVKARDSDEKAIMVTLQHVGDTATAWVATCVSDHEGERLGPFVDKTPARSARDEG